jgi:hypothetical protein
LIYTLRAHFIDITHNCAFFVWLISHQPVVLLSQNKSAISNQPAVLFSQNKSAPAISHQPNEQAAGILIVLPWSVVSLTGKSVRFSVQYISGGSGRE